MATKLKNLRIRKVDFVDQGANPDADIKLYKRKDGKEPEEDSGRKKSMLKKLFDMICKAAGMNPDEIDSGTDDITKGDSASFNEKISEVKNMKIADEMWDVCYALQSSLLSILNDDELDSDGVEHAMQESLDEFYKVVKESITQWSSGKATGIEKKDEALSDDDIRLMKSAVARLNESIGKAGAPVSEEKQTVEEGEKENMGMKIDKSKLTEAEKAFLESIEKRYGTEEEGDSGNAEGTVHAAAQAMPPAADPAVSKSAPPVTEKRADDTDIYKGLHPAVAAEMAELKKFREVAEEKELTEVAKRYALIGKKPEELVPVLKSLKAAGGTAYNDMIAVLDQTLETVQKSGAFSEIGKSGHGGENSAETKVSTIAKKYVEDHPELSYQEAVAKAWEDHPELLDEYDEQEGF
ncbi:MAG: hypothetical protein NC409_12480 [Clostridium sp.]|nr:hypothetical protein [Clostridium sp.]